MLADLHRYLFPERYADVPTYYWYAGTIEDVAALVEAALPDAPWQWSRGSTVAPGYAARYGERRD